MAAEARGARAAAERAAGPRFRREQAAAAGFGPDEVAEIEVAAGEAVTNAILYGHHAHAPSEKIAVVVGVAGATLFVEVRDSGPGFDPQRVRPTVAGDVDALGGRGLPLMQALMDHVDLHFDGTGMRVRLERSLPRAC